MLSNHDLEPEDRSTAFLSKIEYGFDYTMTVDQSLALIARNPGTSLGAIRHYCNHALQIIRARREQAG